MRMEVTTLGIEIIPENAQDKIYIENFLGMKKENDVSPCIRKNVSGLSSLSYIEIIPNRTKE